MAKISLVIMNNPRTKKNSMQIVTIGGKPRLIQAKRYRDYEKDALKQLQAWGNQYIPGKVHVKCLYYCKDRRKRDLSNLMAATHDILQKAGLIEDDAMIYSVDGSRVLGADKNNPRCEIIITSWEE